jgi:hypothetical protein
MRLRPGDRLPCSNPDWLELIVLEMGSDEERRELPRCWSGSPMNTRASRNSLR